MDPSEESRASQADESLDMDRASEVIESQLGLEVLLKHRELQLVNQELAKCQTALEQLRRCHLIPYPVSTPTPEQMLDIAKGSGSALRPKLGEKLPQWAPPFGVTDGPYARHYAKWLIPDPKFDSHLPDFYRYDETARIKMTAEGRSTRNGPTEPAALPSKGGRPSRGNAGQKLQSLSNGYPQPKGQAGPCILKRSDGKTVKLVCIDCNRENFSSTQGFINHCRIAHKRDYKSHDEAAMACGHLIDPAETMATTPIVKDDKPSIPAPVPVASSGFAHPFTRSDGMSDSEACFSVVRRIEQSLAVFRQGKISSTAGTQVAIPRNASFAPSTDSPHLSRHLQNRGFSGDFGSLVSDTKTKLDFDQVFDLDEDETDASATPADEDTPGHHLGATATGIPVSGSRVPAAAAANRPAGNKGPLPAKRPVPVMTPTPRELPAPVPVMPGEDMMDVDLSPNTAVSNNAPSLVSDDGEYDDSVADSDSATDIDDRIDAGSISDVDEIDLEDHNGASTLGHQGTNAAPTGTTVRLRQDDSKHVTFVSPVSGNRPPSKARGRKYGHDAGH